MSHVHTILVPMDGSLSARAGLFEAVEMARDLDARLELVHVSAPNERGEYPSERARRDAERDMTDAYDEAKARLGDRVTRRGVVGDPLRAILELASDERIDLIVMGTHGRVGRLHARVGSLAEAVVRNAPCPVLTVRFAGGADEAFAERVHARGREALSGVESRHGRRR